jgi:hypothetical protein
MSGIAYYLAREIDESEDVMVNMAGKGYKAVQMNMREGTLNKVAELQELLGSGNRTDAIKMAIDVTEIVASALSHGGRIIIEKKDGEKSEVVIPGLNK